MKRRLWTVPEIRLLKKLYPDHPASHVAKLLGIAVHRVHSKAARLGLKKSAAFLASDRSGRIQRGHTNPRMIAARFKKGHVPANKGLRRPGWHAGRMRETQFKKGQFPILHDPEFYVLGALRVNTDGYVDMRTSFEPGSRGWTPLHRILWEDKHGPLPEGYCLRFIDGDRANCCLENIECITRAENARRNSIHRLPPDLKAAIQLNGQLKRRIRERLEQSTGKPGRGRR